MDAKKFLFLSSAQRWVISLALLGLVVVAMAGFWWAPQLRGPAELGAASLELLKLLLTAAAAWVLVLLYASSNSFERIEKETVRFLTRDLCRPGRPLAQIDGIALRELEASAPMAMRRVSAERTSVTYEVKNAQGDMLHLWCNLNVNEVACVFMLPEQHAADYQRIYGAALSGFTRRGVEVTCFGKVPHSFEGEPVREYLELYLVRELASDFLFDAGARVRLAQSLWGDLRAFLVCAARERETTARPD